MNHENSVVLLLACSCLCTAAAPHFGKSASTAISVPSTSPSDAGVPLEAFISYSIEFSSFPDFAGNLSSPNAFSDNLLNNIGHLAGTKPYVRVGGNTQDFAIFNASQKLAEIGIYNASISEDYPSQITIGPAYFESYRTWPDTRFVHGFNLGRSSTAARRALLESVPYACKALENGRLLHWELGNEPDLFKNNNVRSTTWDEKDYVNEWLFYTREIRKVMGKACPNLATRSAYTYYAPSFAGTSNTLDPIRTWEDGIDADKDIAIISSHNYISGANSPGVTLQGTLMNHSSTVASIAKQLNESHLLSSLPANLNPNLPFILGETNSLYNQGRPGLSNTFGAALWGVDFNLWCATNNISRVHMHQGTNYRYQSWQPIDTDKVSKGTKAPYYGNIAVAAFLGDLTSPSSSPRIVNLPLPDAVDDEKEAAYAAYVKGHLARLIVIDMHAYNRTDYNREYYDSFPRPVEKYRFQLPWEFAGRKAQLQQLMANGSDAITGVTFDGHSYNYELDEGKPVLLRNVTRGQTVEVGRDGELVVEVPWSSAVLVRFDTGHKWSWGSGWGWW